MFRVSTRIHVSTVSTEMVGRLGELSVRRTCLLGLFTLFCLSDIVSGLHWSCFERRPFHRVCGLRCVPLSGAVFRLLVFHALFLGLETFRLQVSAAAQWASGRSVGHLLPGCSCIQFCVLLLAFPMGVSVCVVLCLSGILPDVRRFYTFTTVLFLNSSSV